jgi:hypothetical protein
MNKIILSLSLITLLSACGKKESAPVPEVVTGKDPLTTIIDIDSLVGTYDLIREDAGECGTSIQLNKRCEGIQLIDRETGNESFCNINLGEITTGDNRSSTNVTLEENVLKSVVLIFDERSTPPRNVKEIFTNSITLDEDGNIFKVSDLRNKKSSCLYQKR